jgi:DNA-binding transcriptional MerR regulator
LSGALDLGVDSKVYPVDMARTISALADTLGLSSDTLRYYDRLGLLRPTERTAAGYRLYDETAAERLRFIRGAQRMGLQLGGIKELLEINDRGQCPCGHTRVLVERRLAEVEAKIAQLEEVREQLLDLQRRNESCVELPDGDWSCCVIGGG